MTPRKHILKHFHMCCGLGGGARGFNRAKPVVGNLQVACNCIVDAIKTTLSESLNGGLRTAEALALHIYEALLQVGVLPPDLRGLHE
ncbi:hypothetical protein D3C77_366420 [compost metagenome]